MGWYGFAELEEEFQELGYPADWLNADVIDRIAHDARGVKIGGLDFFGGHHFHARLEFDFSSGRLELDHMRVCLLDLENGSFPVKPDGMPEQDVLGVLDVLECKELLPIRDIYPAMIIKAELAKQQELLKINSDTMNRNSLEAFREEAKALKVPQAMIDAAEKEMERGVPKIELQGRVPGDKGMLDLTIHIRQSAQSDFYYFNKFDLALDKAKPLEKDHGYMVVSPNPDQAGKNLSKSFTSVNKAMEFFRDQKGTAELSVGKFSDKDMAFRDTLATMKEGKIDYVKKDFQKAFYSPVIKNSHYVDRGKGFSIEQAANMLQGRSVFREDMVSRAGEQYKAWSQYQFNEPKDKYGNYTMKQYSEGYGFDLRKELDKYEIKELHQQASTEKLVAELQNGNKVAITAMGPDGEHKQLRLEAVPKYSNINFSDKDGRPHKREDYLAPEHLDKGKDVEKGKDKEKSKESNAELSI